MPVTFHDYECKSKLNHKRKLAAALEDIAVKYGMGIRLKSLACVFCKDDYLLVLNKKYLDHDTLTDIITFDLSDPAKPGALDGELYISVERVKENAGLFGNSYQDELLRVIFHGMLHLCGYKDKTNEDLMLMRKQEDECLSYYRSEYLS